MGTKGERFKIEALFKMISLANVPRPLILFVANQKTSEMPNKKKSSKLYLDFFEREFWD